jgi:hypothetical protein
VFYGSTGPHACPYDSGHNREQEVRYVSIWLRELSPWQQHESTSRSTRNVVTSSQVAHLYLVQHCTSMYITLGKNHLQRHCTYTLDGS